MIECPFQIKKTQQKIFDILDSKKINYDALDISQEVKVKDLMRELAGDPTALPPQIFNGNNYCGVSLNRQHAIV